MGTAEKEENMGPYWVSSTNWLVTSGSLEGSITMVTSSSTVEDADAIPIGVLLERPLDSPPCEITIFFRGKHEIHSIYVRSTARIYEIYYASDKKINSNEYLCTVRCGAAVSEDINAVLPRNDSNNTMEDGWVEIQVPGSLGQENTILSLSNISGESIFPPLQTQKYEATAEISDSSPCMSVTLRLLSHQIKTSVHMEEIYIFADLIEDNDQDPPVYNGGAGSFLSMLVPGLLHLSKSGGFQLNGKGFSEATAGSKFSSSSDRDINASFADKSEISKVAASSMMKNSMVGFDPYHVSELKTDETFGARGCVENALDEPIVKHTQTMSAEVEKGLDQSQKAKSNETNDAYGRLEKILDDLVSRIGRIENFCSSFKESILKPLTGIDIRLQRMEEQLDQISRAAPLSSETDPSSKLSCHSDHNYNLGNEGCIPLSAVTESSSHEKEAEVNVLTVSLPESLKSPGLVVKAPEFPDDDDDDESTSNDNLVDLMRKEHPQKDMPLSIDSALASELAAFITSTTGRSYVHSSHPMAVPNEQQISDNHFVDSAYVAVHSVVEWVLEDKNCDMPYEARDKTSQSDKSCYDVLVSDSKLKINDTFDITDAKLHDCLCDESLLLVDQSSHVHGPKGLIIRQPEVPYEDDILNCNKISDSQVSNYPDAHSHTLSDSESTRPPALFLSSGRSSCSKSSSISHDDPLVPISDDNFIKSKLHPESSELNDMDFFIRVDPVSGQHSGSPETFDVSSEMNTGSTPPLALFFSSRRSSSFKSSSNSHDCPLVQSSDDIFIKSKLRPESFESNNIDSFIMVDPVSGQHSGNPVTLDVSRQMNSHFELQLMSSFIPVQDDFSSNIKFNADKTLRSWLPLEVLLSEKSDDKVYNGEDLVGNLEFHVDKTFIDGPSAVVLDEKPDDQIESSDYANDTGIVQQPNPLIAHAFTHCIEIVDNNLLDMPFSVDQSEVSGMAKAGTQNNAVCFCCDQPISSLI